MSNTLRVTDRIRYGNRATLGYAEQSETFEIHGFHHGLEVFHESLEREVFHVSVGETVPARVVPNQQVPWDRLATGPHL